ncbi:hypothetical protein [Flavobacterium suncheonense]|uniref:Uncharacterized protein n=1 Tax=Flavobacterium suncheonense GH29-5 = DSM 17707 TaxID=1121899 RepID=A0A0A2M5F0_9FLAO|nr:hypothetical protein [Flavobacterium suncheonense]KGO87887.1 hypothetical protein Q764_12095 [Flavobacterium suncheonense GH29-5 = DSM 17707]
MVNKESHPIIKLTLQSGGSIDFEKTGVLPEFLIFNSPDLRRTWRVKLKENKQQGMLKVHGQVAFYYIFDGLVCKMQSVNNGVVTSEWDIEEYVMEMRD